MKSLDQRSYFFDAGVRFTCRRCGACCTGAPGIVRVSDVEITAIAAYLGLSGARVIAEYLTDWENGYRVREADDGCCLFYADGCRIHAARPKQCRTFPFWMTNLRSEARWKALTRECPGIGTGRHYTKEEILNILAPTEPVKRLPCERKGDHGSNRPPSKTRTDQLAAVDPWNLDQAL